jgi:23S rRNA (cytidine1920-2'-O)/16S rRNA (cytidine1409-2'-O)-methyltransferase
MSKMRLDVLLVERGLAESRAKAQSLIMAGEVRVDGQVALKSAVSVDSGARVDVERGPRFVSRGGEKLDAALAAFDVPVSGRICADVGASTGGFTDCLLQRGAARVYAIDVGKGILHWKLRNDPRVVVMEDTNARYVRALPEPTTLITIDASFISLKILLPVVRGWFSPADFPGGEGKIKENRDEVMALIKPQFEAGRQDVGRGDGVIRDPFVHQQVLTSVLAFAASHGFGVRGLVRSPLLGPKGNIEFLAWLAAGAASEEIPPLIESALQAPGPQS